MKHPLLIPAQIGRGISLLFFLLWSAASLTAAPVADTVKPSNLNYSNLITWFGRFHVVFVHFPIALILFGTVVTFAKSWFARYGFSDKKRFSHTGYHTLLGGTFFAGCSAVLGWMTAWHRDYGSVEINRDLLIHRILGTSVFFLSMMACYTGWRFQKTKQLGTWRVYLFFLLLSSLIVGAAGHFGGVLTYGSDRFEWPP